MIGSQGVHSDQAKLDMWNLVYAEKIGRIVTVTPEMKDVRYSECQVYIPTKANPEFKVGKYVVKCVEETKVGCVITRKLKFSDKTVGVERTLTHVHFLGWEDLSVPEDKNM